MPKTQSQPPRSVGDEMIRRLTDFADALASGQRLPERFTARQVEIPQPKPYTRRQVKRIRESLHMSQAVFAQAIGVSAELVRSWESDKRPVGPLASRLLQMIEADPQQFVRRIMNVSPAPGESTKLRRAK
jgi:putative transcriptional regulator